MRSIRRDVDLVERILLQVDHVEEQRLLLGDEVILRDASAPVTSLVRLGLCGLAAPAQALGLEVLFAPTRPRLARGTM